jgi:hypothetical protein
VFDGKESLEVSGISMGNLKYNTKVKYWCFIWIKKVWKTSNLTPPFSYSFSSFFSSHYTTIQTIKYLDIKNLVKPFDFVSFEIFFVIFRTGRPIKTKIIQFDHVVFQKCNIMKLSYFTETFYFFINSPIFLILYANCLIYRNRINILQLQPASTVFVSSLKWGWCVVRIIRFWNCWILWMTLVVSIKK